MQNLLAVALPCVGIGTGGEGCDNTDEENQKSKSSINNICLTIHRPRPDALVYKVEEGRASADEQKTLLEYYEALAKFSPPRGNAAGWTRSTGALIEASRGVIKGEEKSKERLAKARDCRGCHTVHK